MKRYLHGDPFLISSGSSAKPFSIKNKPSGQWIEIDDVSKNQTRVKSQLGVLLSQDSIRWWAAVLCLCIGVLVARTAYLQIISGQHFRAVAEGNRLRILDVKATRGIIVDANKQVLVENVPSFSLAVVPVDLPKDQSARRQLAEELSKISHQSADTLFQLLAVQSRYSYQPLVIQENIDQQQAIMAKILSSTYPGVILKIDNIRNYPTSLANPSWSHILGYTGKIEPAQLDAYLANEYSVDDQIGKAGIEASYEIALKGVNGKQQVEVDASGQAKDIIAYQKPEAGENLMLSVDSGLQAEAERVLRSELISAGKKRGAVVAIDPNTGEVLALVSLPTFDNNLFSHGIPAEAFSQLIADPNHPLFNRAISGEYPPGSTFKLIIGAGALEEKLITPQTSVHSVGGINVGDHFFPDWKAGGHGWTNIVKGIAESVNTFFYSIGGGYDPITGLGVDRIKQYAEKFGLAKPLGIDLPNEASGFLPDKDWKQRVKHERWYVGDTYNLSIGQGDVLVTPLQIASWTSFFANGGTVYQPHLVKAFLDSDNHTISSTTPQILGQSFISPENIKVINQGLRQTVLTGSAQSLAQLPMTVAAKTGTAQWSSKDQPHSWITTYAPFDHPQIVLTVLVEEGIGGDVTGTPVAKEILRWWAANRYKK